MKLFKDKERNDLTSRRNDESVFTFLNRSGQSMANEARIILNNWFSHFPEDQKNDLSRRLKSKDFDSAFYELYLHEHFFKQGFKIDTHPVIPNSSKRPDFFLSKNGVEFFLEAKVITEPYNTNTFTTFDVKEEVNRIIKSFKDKANHYGNLSKPYVICVNFVRDFILEENDVFDALIGSRCISYSRNSSGNTVFELDRNFDGLIRNCHKDIHKRVSGFYISRVNQYNFENHKHWLFYNPYATYTLDLNILGFNTTPMFDSICNETTLIK